ncbi:MAG TPA: hypothetical protein VGL48_07360 [Acidimicrobiales bacterium]|jgi:putative Mn2+ efflux pump MntP
MAAVCGGRDPDQTTDLSGQRLVLLGAAMRTDNLVVGFALGAFHVTLAVALIIAAVSSPSRSWAWRPVNGWGLVSGLL